MHILDSLDPVHERYPGDRLPKYINIDDARIKPSA